MNKMFSKLQAWFRPESPVEVGHTYRFIMRGGAVIYARHITSLTTRSNEDGSFRSYEIRWVDGHRPRFFSLSSPDIVAIVCDDGNRPPLKK